MYNYRISTYDESGSGYITILHEQKFSKEDFDEMVATAFAEFIIKDELIEDIKEDYVDLEVILNNVTDLLVEKFNFSYIPDAEESFRIYWLLTKNNEDSESKLIYKHIDKLNKNS